MDIKKALNRSFFAGEASPSPHQWIQSFLAFIFIGLTCLLLGGCGRSLPSQTLSTEEAPVSSEEPQAGSAPQVYYDGALQISSPGISNATGLYAFGDGLLVLSGTETTTLTLLSEDGLTSTASVTLPFLLDPEDPSLRLGEGYLSYFDPTEQETVVLDASGHQVSHIPAPEGLQGVPILSGDRNCLYYCTSDGIRVWDLETGLRRRIKEMAAPGQHLTGLALRDTVLACATDSGTSLLSTENGRLLYEASGEVKLSGEKGRYCLSTPLGLGEALLCGEEGGAPQLFLPEDAAGRCYFLPSRAGAVTHARREENRLDYYDLRTGRRVSTLVLSANLVPMDVADTPSGALYLLAELSDIHSCILLRWEVGPENALAVQDETNYLTPWQTADHPDTAAWTQCSAYASQLRGKYGISILIGEDAARVQPWDYSLEPETQPGILLRELQSLEKRLSRFPASILLQTASHFSSLNLCIVRSVTGTAESGNPKPAAGTQFLDGTDAYVVITAGKYGEQALYHELFHAMETHIFTNSSALDQWSKLNPQEFFYTYGVSDTADYPETWLMGEYRAFLDTYAMTFPKEDRSRIFEAAMEPGNKETFQPWMMQRKLKTICLGIREAYGLSESPETYPWEQYLDFSLAYKEEVQ